MRKRCKAGQSKISCSKCNIELEDNRKGKYRYCKKCHAEWMRNYRPKYNVLPATVKTKMNCCSATNVNIERGKLTKSCCCICGDVNSQAHHEDYNKPKEIIWYCRKHHLEYHEIKKQNNK